MHGHPRAITALALVVGAISLVIGCGSGSDASLVSDETQAPAISTIAPSTDSTSTPASPSTVPEEILDELFVFSEDEHRVVVSPQAVERALATGDRRFLPPLVELTRWVLLFHERNAVQTALHELTGQSYEGYDFFNWYSWLGRNYEGPEFENYPSWKAQLYNHIDPRFAKWFHDGVESEIPLWTAQWGGVKSDGIPPLDNPRLITAGEAIFMEPDEPVFGVSINGEARAYPHRFMNWHEMANDVVGGKPVTLAY